MTHESKAALQKLGARLADLLDEDQWVECEELLIEAGALPPDIERLVDQFLAWKLPGDFSPDAGITFNPGHITLRLSRVAKRSRLEPLVRCQDNRRTR